MSPSRTRCTGCWAGTGCSRRCPAAALPAARASDRSWDGSNPQLTQRGGAAFRGELLFLLLVGEEEASALVVEPEVGHAQHTHTQTDLGADWVQRGVKGFFGDAEI